MLGIPLIEAANYIVPLTKSSAETVRQLRESSSGKYLSASYDGLYTYNGEAETALDASSIPNLSVSPMGRKVRA